MKVLAREGRFVVGLYRRHMKVIGYLGKLDRLFGAAVTTRNWNTVTAIAKVLDDRACSPVSGSRLARDGILRGRWRGGRR